jgi:hypothetical protein
MLIGEVQVVLAGRLTNETVTDKIRKYRSDYNNNPPDTVSFMTAMSSTSGRLHQGFHTGPHVNRTFGCGQFTTHTVRVVKNFDKKKIHPWEWTGPRHTHPFCPSFTPLDDRPSPWPKPLFFSKKKWKCEKNRNVVSPSVEKGTRQVPVLPKDYHTTVAELETNDFMKQRSRRRLVFVVCMDRSCKGTFVLIQKECPSVQCFVCPTHGMDGFLKNVSGGKHSGVPHFVYLLMKVIFLYTC